MVAHRYTSAAPALLAFGRMSRSALLPSRPPTSRDGRGILTHFPGPLARLTAYLQQQDEASLTAFLTASRVSPVSSNAAQ